MSRRILCVDDEEQILKAYARFFKSFTDEWVLEFALSAEEAISKLEHGEYFDLIMTDIRMPGMDGITFLQKVSELSPDTIRLAISGHFDEHSVMQSLKFVHQCLFKPCPPNEIKQAFERAFNLQEVFEGTLLRRIANRVNSVPSIPFLYNEVLKILSDDESSGEDIAAVVSKDPGMSAKMLQVVNSSYFGYRRTIHNVKEAVVVLGVELIKTMVLSVQLFQRMDTDGIPTSYIEELWEHGFVVGTMAKTIVRYLYDDVHIMESAFTAGVLHDIGKLILLSEFPVAYKSQLLDVKTDTEEELKIEKRALGICHPEMGGYLMRLWGLDDLIVEAILFHHEPRNASFGISVLSAVHMADAFYYEFLKKKSFMSRMDKKYLKQIGINEQEIEVLRKKCRACLG